VIVDFIDAHRDEFGVEPICKVLQVAPSTYRAAKRRESAPSTRAVRDAAMMQVLMVLWVANRKVYGAHKLWKAARRAGHDIGRDQVARLMRELDIRGVSRRRKKVFTTVADPDATRAPDLVDRNFTADRPDALWVTDITYVPTRSGMGYVCFIVDAYSRRIVGWTVASHMKTSMVLGALEMARRSRGSKRLVGLVTHSDAGSQGGFNWSSQHLDEEVVDGQASWMDEGVDGTVADEVARRSVASTRDRARVLETRCDRDHERGRSRCSRGVPGGRESLVPAWWRDATNGPETWIGPLSVVR
jgi:putative transposase